MKVLQRRTTGTSLLMAAALVYLWIPGLWAADGSKSKPSATGDGAPAPAEQASKSPKWYGGNFSTEFDGAWGRHGDGVNLTETLQFQVDPPQCDRLHLRGFLWVFEDLAKPPKHSSLRNLKYVYDSDVVSHVSYLYADVDDLWGKSTLRMGRQRIMEGLAFNRIDGVYFKQRLQLGDWYAFAGTRATFYGHDFEDPVFGGGASFSPNPRLKVGLDGYYSSEEKYLFDEDYAIHSPIAALIYYFSDLEIDHHVSNGAIGLSVWETVNEYLSLFGRFNWVDGGGDEFLLSATGSVPAPWKLVYEAIYRHQFGDIEERVNDLTGYYRILGTYEEYDDVCLAVYRPITDKLTMSVEGEWHDSRDTTWSNRDYSRAAVSLAGKKLWAPYKIDGHIGLEYWNVTDDEGTWAVFGEIGRDWKDVKAALGVDFQRYEDEVVEYSDWLLIGDMVRVWFSPGAYQWYNPLLLLGGRYAVETHENIYTVYAKSNWAIDKAQDLNARLTYQEFDGRDSPTWRVEVGYTLRF